MPTPTVTPKPGFSAEEECQALRKAMKGFGTDEKALINCVTGMSNSQRQEVVVVYKTMFGKDLIDDIKSEISGDFEDTIVALFLKPAFYDAKCLNKAMKGLGTDDRVLVEIMCSRNNSEIAAIKEAYKKEYKQTLEEAIKGDTSGDYERLLVSLCQGAREEKAADAALAAADAQKLYEAGEKTTGTDESTFNYIMALRSYDQLRATFREYKKITGHEFLKAIQKECSGNVERTLAGVFKVAIDPVMFFADCLHKSMAGAGTDEDRLIRVVVSRSEIDLGDIKEAFRGAYGGTLAKWIRDDVRGDFRRALLGVVKE